MTALLAAPPATATEGVPVTLLTGFLGSGKTTLLAALLADPAMADTAVIVNEFGEVGLDHHLLQRLDGETVLLPGGCLCCTVSDDLAATLQRLLRARADGSVPRFSRVAIETTGLADPAPILAALLTDPQLAGHLGACTVVTTVDALHGMTQLDEHLESVRQVAMADRLVLTKTDLAPPGAVVRLRARLAHLNPGAPVHVARAGRLHAALLLEPPAQRVCVDAVPHDHGPGCGEHCAHPAHGGVHDRRVRSHAMTFDEPFEWEVVAHWLGSVAFFHGEQLLRVKGLLAVAGLGTPVAVHGVRHLVHEPAALPAWPDADRRSRVVFITCDLGREPIEAALRRAQADARAAQALDPGDAPTTPLAGHPTPTLGATME